MSSIIFYALVGAVIGLSLWFVAMAWLRSKNFDINGSRFFDARGGENRSAEIKYHNEAIYRDFEYFFKITLAILGGIAFVVTREKEKINWKAISPLLESASLLQVVAGILLSLFIIFHQKSKIERWGDRYSMHQIITWQECWMIVSMLAVSFSIAFGVTPEVLKALGVAGRGG